MIYRFETVYSDVAALLGESPGLDCVCPPDEEPATLPLRHLVRKYLPIAAVDILDRASIPEIDTLSSFAARPVKTGSDSGRIPLPDDFLRLAAFRMPDWEADETDVTDGRLLISRCKGRIPDVLRRMRTSRNPYLRISRHSGGLCLHFYGTGNPDSVPARALYVARPRWRSDHSISLPETLYPRIVAATAAGIREIP